jgi:hypothetical protein
MPYYNLKRVSDQRIFTAQRVNDAGALFYFSILVGEELTFDGAGSPPYLLGKRSFSVRPVDTRTPVYRVDPSGK